jgi:hypothetical protein
MRFINTTSLKFHEVSDLELQKLKYSILSHRWTWGNDEILYVDVLCMDSGVKSKGGYAKFADACALAERLGYEFLWIDTCCINKTDAAELAEAINSMYRWYSMANVCIAYLQDATSTAQITESEWFNRGWTLQELIAPKDVRFYDRDWNYIGDKFSLCNMLVRETGIPADVLQNSKPPQACSIAQRMSWAAKRTTKRPEDMAYSLMGLFDVNMPMIYGERERAFIRLQEQIISKSADESIFVWDLDLLEDSTRDARNVYCGLLASSPACFERCGDVVCIGRSRGFSINQFGLSTSFPAQPYTFDTYQASLNCTKAEAAGYCAILLVKLPDGESFARTSGASGESVLMVERRTDTFMGFSVPFQPREMPLHFCLGFWLRKVWFFYDTQIQAHEKIERRYSKEDDRLLLPNGEFGTAGIIKLTLRDRHHRPLGFGWIKLGFDSACHPVCFMTFPNLEDDDPDTQKMLAETEELRSITRGSSERLKHPIFNNDWIYLSSRTISELPSYSYHSRMGSYDHRDGFEFTFKAPLFEISASVKKIPDITPTTSQKGEIWAVDLVAGPAPQVYHAEGWCRC